MRGVRVWTALGLLLLLSVGCAVSDEQAVRHAVAAEFETDLKQ
jgi:hypothetical protein